MRPAKGGAYSEQASLHRRTQSKASADAESKGLLS